MLEAVIPHLCCPVRVSIIPKAWKAISYPMTNTRRSYRNSPFCVPSDIRAVYLAGCTAIRLRDTGLTMNLLPRIALTLLAAVLFVPQLLVALPHPALPAQAQDRQDGGMGEFQDHAVQGDITAISGSTISVKTDDGQVYTVATGPNTRFRKERDLIKLSDLHVGDMIAAVGDKDTKAKSLGAVAVVVIDKTRYEQMRADFGKTWTAGVVQSISGTNIVIKRPDNVTQTIAVDENTEFRQRHEDIVLPDIKPGDNLTARGALRNGAFLATLVNVGRPGIFRNGGNSDSRSGIDQTAPQPRNQP